jgi:hypothetical protein
VLAKFSAHPPSGTALTMDYNNDPKTTFADVQTFFALLEKRIEKRLDAQERH